MRFLEEVWLLIERLWPEAEKLWPLLTDLLMIIIRGIGKLFTFIGENFSKILDHIFDVIQIFFKNRVLDLIFTYWKEILICIALAGLFLAHKLFPRWKKAHLASYAIVEIGLGLITIASALPWKDNILSFDSYNDLLIWPNSVPTALKILGGIYLSVRGEENWQKAHPIADPQVEG